MVVSILLRKSISGWNAALKRPRVGDLFYVHHYVVFPLYPQGEYPNLLLDFEVNVYLSLDVADYASGLWFLLFRNVYYCSGAAGILSIRDNITTKKPEIGILFIFLTYDELIQVPG